MAHPAVRAFARGLDEIDRSKRRSAVFADFCELAYRALAKRARPLDDQRDRPPVDTNPRAADQPLVSQPDCPAGP